MFHPPFYNNRGSIFLFILVLIALSTSAIYVSAPKVLSETASVAEQGLVEKEIVLEKSVFVNLGDMTITLRDGTSSPVVMPIISKGKPGSYYETP